MKPSRFTRTLPNPPRRKLGRHYGEATFALREPVVQGSPFLASLLDVLDVDVEDLAIDPIRLVLNEGRISYGEPWVWTFNGMETTFGGSIGLDETLDLAWEVPITRELVKKHDFLKVLEGKSIEVPITGTSPAQVAVEAWGSM